MFQNKVCVITGGALGIGKCLVERFSKKGARVIFIDNKEEALIQTEKQYKKLGYDVTGFFGDISEEAILEEFVQFVIENYDSVHFLINNACISRKGILSECSYDDFNYVLKVGITAPYILAKLLKNHFCLGASIVNIASTRAFQSQEDTESYTAAKGGILALTHALSVSLAGIARVNSVSPGWIDTGRFYHENYFANHSEADMLQHSSGRIGLPEDIANTVEFLCEDRNSFINGQNITVDGGMTTTMIYHNDYGWQYNG